MKRFISKIFMLSALLVCGPAMAECEMDNAALQAMKDITVIFTRTDKSQFSITAKYADNNTTRAAGFQRVCSERVDNTAILFHFERALIPSFHMNNVVAPLDIAFIDEQGQVDSIHLMQVYSLLLRNKPLYSSTKPIVAALEARKNFYVDNKVDAGTTITWELIE